MDNISKTQFMPVAALLDLHSQDALAERHYVDIDAVHGDHTRVRDVEAAKADYIAANPRYQELDEPIRSGSIDPVLLHRTDSGENEVLEGHRRITRAHQLGVERLPVSYDPGSQAHMWEWAD
jgi:hypothetical protein